MKLALTKPFFFLSATLAVAALLFTPTAAEAGVEACGDFVITAETECELIPPGASCTTQCTPLSVEVSCAVDLQAQCSAECQGSVDVECSGSCEADCSAACEVNPGSFDCSGYCQADCAGDCEAQCSDSQCQATCEANCSAHCDAECDVVPASANCDAACEGSCSGSCTAESSLSCQSACTGSLYADCVTDVQGGCETACESTDGALFCDGQYVDLDGSLAACAAALTALFDIEIDGYAEAGCEGNTCSAEAGVGCSAGGQRGALAAALVVLMALLAIGWRRQARS